MRSDSGPIPQVLEEVHVELAIVIVMEHAALNTAETDHNIIPWDYILRGVTSVLVCESSDELVRELILDRISDLIHEPHHEAGLAALLPGQSVALVALAEVTIVVLLHGINQEIRIITHHLLDLIYAKIKYFRIRETQLGVA